MAKEAFWLCLFVLVGAGTAVLRGKEDCDCNCSCCFTPNPKSCAHYCFCSETGRKGTSRKCPGRQMFNPEIMNCDEPENFKCFELEVPKDFRCDPEKNDFHAYPERCDYYIHCSNGFPHVRNCPEATHWCQSCPEQRCEHPDAAGCDRPPPTTSQPSLTTVSLMPTQKPPTPPPGHCVHEQYYPDPESCESYYHCSHNKLWPMICPASLHFCLTCDPPVCQFPRIANCVLPRYNASGILGIPGIVKVVSPYFNSDSGPGLDCPLPDSVYPVPADPTLYLLCRSGVGAFFRCPPRMAFDPQVLSCSPRDTRPWNRQLSMAECRAHIA